MLKLDFHPAGRHFLQIPGPSPVPDRILRAMSYPTIDHRGPEFGELGLKVLDGIKKIFKTQQPVVIYPASGTGAWEAALSNTLSPGDHVLMFETGHFATLWKKMAESLGLKPEFLGLPGIEGWRRGVQPQMIEERLRADTQHAIKAVCVVHNETSTGVTSDIAAVRRAIDAAGHPALVAGRHDLRPCLRRLSSRRMGRRRHRLRLAKRSDAAAGHQLQRDLAESHRPPASRRSCRAASGPGRDRRDEQDRLLAVHAEHQPALRTVRSARHDPRRRARQRVRPPRASGRSVPAARCVRGAWRSSAPIRPCTARCSPA